MANEQRTDAPLTAAVGEQLKEKAHLDEVRAAEREPGEVVAHRVERKKADERDAARRHAAAPVRRARAATPRWRLLAGGLVLLGALLVIGRLVRR